MFRERGQNGNRLLSALILKMRGGPQISLQPFGMHPMKSHYPPQHPSPVQALNHETRPESRPDRKFSPERGGLSDSTSRRTSALPGTIKNKTLPAMCWSGLLDACLERAGLREDRDLHSEAWVLVTRATDTPYRAAGKARSKLDPQNRGF